MTCCELKLRSDRAPGSRIIIWRLAGSTRADSCFLRGGIPLDKGRPSKFSNPGDCYYVDSYHTSWASAMRGCSFAWSAQCMESYMPSAPFRELHAPGRSSGGGAFNVNVRQERHTYLPTYLHTYIHTYIRSHFGLQLRGSQISGCRQYSTVCYTAGCVDSSCVRLPLARGKYPVADNPVASRMAEIAREPPPPAEATAAEEPSWPRQLDR